MIATLHWPVAVLISALSSCLSIRIGAPERTSHPQAEYRLEDNGTAGPRRASPIALPLVVSPMRLNVIGESYSLVFSRAAQQRSFYQFASWTDQPTFRIAQLLVDRLEARGSFRSVSVLGHGVRGDLMLNLIVEDLFHDATTTPGTARIELRLELIDRATRTLIARRDFRASSPVADSNAAAAVVALNRATGLALDEMIPWLEQSGDAWVAQHPPNGQPSNGGSSVGGGPVR